jgi:hypothetical protein
MLFSDAGKQEFDHGEIVYSDEKKSGIKRFIRNKLLKTPKLYFGKILHDKLKQKYIIESSRDKIVLNFGSGHHKLFEQENFINFDIFPHSNAHVSGDGHELPFLDDSIDVVWLCASLTRLLSPIQALMRVLQTQLPPMRHTESIT